MIKDIHRPFWTSLFNIPDPGKYPTDRKILSTVFVLDENTIDQLADDLVKNASIKS